ncbi:MAG: hypothetical protein LBK13_08370 [Spirochaetales bacterium]|jgi:hypothetical protein|nr:hypothetical protein [Spirochaetales bacterium]
MATAFRRFTGNLPAQEELDNFWKNFKWENMKFEKINNFTPYTNVLINYLLMAK